MIRRAGFRPWQTLICSAQVELGHKRQTLTSTDGRRLSWIEPRRDTDRSMHIPPKEVLPHIREGEKIDRLRRIGSDSAVADNRAVASSVDGVERLRGLVLVHGPILLPSAKKRKPMFDNSLALV